MDSKGRSILTLARMSDEMVKVLLTHPTIKPDLLVLRYAVLNYDCQRFKMLLEPEKYGIKINFDYIDNINASYNNKRILTQTEKNELLLQILRDTIENGNNGTYCFVFFMCVGQIDNQKKIQRLTLILLLNVEMQLYTQNYISR